MGPSVLTEKDVVDPITMLLYSIHSALSFQECKTLAALANVPSHIRSRIRDGLDLFTYLADMDLVHQDYLEMLLSNIRRHDLLDLVQRFYAYEWKHSAFAFTMETYRQTGEVPVVPRTQFKTVETTAKHTYDVYILHASSDRALADMLTQRLSASGITLVTGEFKEVWSEDPPICRYCLPILSKAFLQQSLSEQLLVLLEREINPAASLRSVIPMLSGITPEYLAEQCPALETVAQFSYVSGLGEFCEQSCRIINKGLKTSVDKWHRAPAILHCLSKHQSGKSQTFDVRLGLADSFSVNRSDDRILFRGDKGIKGLRDSHQEGHCTISTSHEDEVCVSVRAMGHPLTFVSIIAPIFIPRGVSTLMLGREWISIAGKRNAQQCQAKIRLNYPVDDERLYVKVITPSVREEVTFQSCVVVGSGESSNLKIMVPGVDIAKQHCKLTHCEEGGWILKPVSGNAHAYLQLPRDVVSDPVCVPDGGEILVGTCTTISVSITETIAEDEGIGLSETCSRMSGKSTKP